MNRIPPILNQLYAREKQLLYENSVLKVQHNEMVSAINTLQSEIETLEKKNNENHKNHANSLMFLQNKNANLNKTLNLKQKQLNLLMQKYDINSSSPLFAERPDFNSDSDTEYATNVLSNPLIGEYF